MRIVSIFLKTKIKHLEERDKTRKSKTKGKKIIKKLHQEIKPLKGEIIINSSTQNKNQIINSILKEIK